VDGLVPKGDVPDALWFGIGVHEALAAWYLKGKKRGPHPADTFLEWLGDEQRHILVSPADHERAEGERAKFDDARELGVSMLEGYVENYGNDDHWDVLAIERPFKVLVKYRGISVAHFWSTWDGVYRDRRDGRIYLMEHKTASQIQPAYLELDDQGGVYWALAGAILRKDGTLKDGEEIAGIQYNFLRKSRADERPRDASGAYLNQNGSVSKRQPPERFVRPEPIERSRAERRTQLERLANEVTWMNAMRDGTMPVIKSTMKDCTFCEFFIMCKAHERGGDAWRQIARAQFNGDQDPYDRYRKAA
jgi:hypothetical protein